MTDPLISIETLAAPLDAKPKPVFRASSLERYDLCPGSYAACLELESKSGDAAAAGTRGHDWLAGNKSIVLPPDDLELAQRFDEAEQEMAQSFFGDDVPEAEHEVALTADLGICTLSGHLDRLRRRALALINDWKFGFLPVTESAFNLQGAGYAYLTFHNYGIDDIRVCFRTRTDPGTMESAAYGFSELLATRERIEGIAHRALAPDAPRIVSEPACRYCPAKNTHKCPESQAVVALFSNPLLSRQAVAAAMELATPAQREVIVDRMKMVKPLFDEIEKQAKAGLAADPEYMPNFFLMGTGATRTIEKGREALIKIVADGLLTEEEAWGAVKLSVSQIEELYYRKAKDADKKNTRKSTEAAVESSLGPLVISVDKEKRLERKRESKLLVRSKDAPGTIDEKGPMK